MPIFANGRWRPSTALQWAPTRTSHDPNPPMTLEDAPASAAAGYLALIGGYRLGGTSGAPTGARALFLPLMGVA